MSEERKGLTIENYREMGFIDGIGVTEFLQIKLSEPNMWLETVVPEEDSTEEVEVVRELKEGEDAETQVAKKIIEVLKERDQSVRSEDLVPKLTGFAITQGLQPEDVERIWDNLFEKVKVKEGKEYLILVEKVNLSPRSVKRVTDNLFETGQIQALQVLRIKKLLESEGADSAQRELERVIEENGLR